MDDAKAAGPGRDITSESWSAAAWKASIVVLLSVIVFIVVPNRALPYLGKHVVPLARDAIVLAWMVVGFLAMCWVFVRLQTEWGR